MERDYYEGKDVFLFIKRETDAQFRMVACLDSNSFNNDVELKEVINKCTAGYRDGKGGKATWGMEASGQAISDVQPAEANFQELLEISVSKEIIQVKMANADGSIYRAGRALLVGYSEDTNSEDPMSFTTSLGGLGIPVVKKPVEV